jgi:hypothetical protein
MIYYFLAELVLVFHFCFVLFVVLGQLLALRWPSAGASLNFRGVAKVASIRAATKLRRLSTVGCLRNLFEALVPCDKPTASAKFGRN